MIETRPLVAQKLPRMLMFEVSNRGNRVSPNSFYFFSMIIVSYWVSYGNGLPSLGSLLIPLNQIG